MQRKPFFKTGVGLFLIGAITGTLVPTFMDFFHFWLQNFFYNNPLPKWQYTLYQILDYYFLDTFFYLILIIVALILHIRNVKTIRIIATIGSIIGLSATITIILLFLTGRL